MFETPLSDSPSRELTGDQQFAQMGFSVAGGKYGGRSLLAVSSVTKSMQHVYITFLLYITLQILLKDPALTIDDMA